MTRKESILFQHKYSLANNLGHHKQEKEKKVNSLKILLEICIAILETRKI